MLHTGQDLMGRRPVCRHASAHGIGGSWQRTAGILWAKVNIPPVL